MHFVLWVSWGGEVEYLPRGREHFIAEGLGNGVDPILEYNWNIIGILRDDAWML